MAYIITNANLIMGNTMIEVAFTKDGGPEMRRYFTVTELRRRVDAGDFGEVFPKWLKARAQAESVDLKTVTFAQLRTYIVGKSIPSAPSPSEADAENGA